jgi:hypothetical protein
MTSRGSSSGARRRGSSASAMRLAAPFKSKVITCEAKSVEEKIKAAVAGISHVLLKPHFEESLAACIWDAIDTGLQPGF